MTGNSKAGGLPPSTGLRDRAGALLPCPFCSRAMIAVASPMPHYLHQRQVPCVLSGLEVYSDDYISWNTRALLASPAPAGAEGPLSDDDLLLLIRAHFAPLAAQALLRTSWKDGIDLDVPTESVKAFARSIARAATPPAEARDLVENVKARADEVSASWDRVTGTIDLDEVELLLRAVAALSPASAKTAEE